MLESELLANLRHSLFRELSYQRILKESCKAFLEGPMSKQSHREIEGNTFLAYPAPYLVSGEIYKLYLN